MATTEAQAPAQGEATGLPEAPEVKLEGQELLDAIKKQVEYYFSKENLMVDAYLVSKMDKDHYVELSVIADFKLVKALTQDESLITEAIKGSTQVVVDDSGKKLKPLNINARTTLILRNILSSAPEADVISFLKAAAGMPSLVSIRSDVGNNWFATFETEEAAKTALEIARTLKWEGKTIGCAMKSENLLKGLNPAAVSRVPVGAAAPYYVPMQYTPNSGYGFSYPQGEGAQGAFRQGGRGGQQGRRGPQGGGGVNGNGVSMGDGGDGGQRKGAKKGKGGGRERRDGKEGGSPEGAGDSAAAQPPINMADFPSLATTGGSKKGSNGAAKEGPSEGGNKAVEAVESKDKENKASVKLNGMHSNGVAEAANGPAAAQAESTTSAPAEAPAADKSSPVKSESLGKKKLSYAQMAQIAAQQQQQAQKEQAAQNPSGVKAE